MDSPFQFRDLQNIYRKLDQVNPGMFTSTNDLSRTLNRVTGTDLFDPGVGGFSNFLKGASTAIDRGIEWAGLDDAGAWLGGKIGGVFGYADAGREAGKGLARGVVDFVPMIAGSVMSGGALPAALAATSVASAGLNAYEKTDSVAQGAMTAALTRYLPGIFNKGHQVGLNVASKLGARVTTPGTALVGGLGHPTTQVASKFIGNTLGQRLAGYGGGQIASMGAFELGDQVANVLSGRGLDLGRIFTPEYAVQQLVGQLPFTILDAPYLVSRGTPADAVQQITNYAERVIQGEIGVESIPDATLDEGEKNKVAASKEFVTRTANLKKFITESDQFTPEQKDALKAKADKELISALQHVETRDLGDMTRTILGAAMESQAKPIEVKLPSMETPKTFEQVQEQLTDINATREVLLLPMTTDASLSRQVETHLTEPVTIAEAVQQTTQAEKNRILEAVEARDKIKPSKRKTELTQEQAQIRVNRAITDNQNLDHVQEAIPVFTDIFSKIDKDVIGEGKSPERELNNVFADWIEKGNTDVAQLGKSLNATLNRTRISVDKEAQLRRDGSFSSKEPVIDFSTEELAQIRADRLSVEFPERRFETKANKETGKFHVVEKTNRAQSSLDAPEAEFSGGVTAQQLNDLTASNNTPSADAARQSIVDSMLDNLASWSDKELAQFYEAEDGAVIRQRLQAVLEHTDGGKVNYRQLNASLPAKAKFESRKKFDEWLQTEDNQIMLKEELTANDFFKVAGKDGVAIREANLPKLLSRIYSRMGMTPEEVAISTEDSLRVASLFSDPNAVRAGEIVSDNVLGLSAQQGGTNRVFLNVRKLSKENKLAPRFVLGHEMYHTLEKLYKAGKLNELDTQKFDSIARYFDDITTSERKLILREAINELAPKHKKVLQELLSDDHAFLTGDELRANLGAMVALSIVTPKNSSRIADFMMHMPKPVQDMFQLFAKWARKLTGGIIQLGRYGKLGLSQELPSQLRESLDHFTHQLQSLARTEKQMAKDVEQLVNMQTITPEGFRIAQRNANEGHEFTATSQLTPELKEVEHFFKRQAGLVEDKEPGTIRRALTSVARTLEPMHQVAARIPSVADMVHLMSDAMASATAASARIRSAFFVKRDADGNLVEVKDMKHLAKVTDLGTANTVFNNLARWRNKEHKNLDENDPYVKAELAKLTPEDKQQVLSAFDSVKASLREVWNVMLSARKGRAELALGTTILASQKDLTVAQAKDLGKAVYKTIELLNSGDPAQMQQAIGIQQQLASKLGTGLLEKVQLAGNEYFNTLGSLKEFLSVRDWFMSERRFGRKQIVYQLEGDKSRSRVSGDTWAEAEAAYREAVGGRIVVPGSKRRDNTDATKTFTVRDEGLLDHVREIDQMQFKILENNLTNLPNGKELLEELKPHLDTGERLAREMVSHDLAAKTNRRLVGGRESLNMMEVHARFIDAAVRSETHAYLRQAASLHRLDPELQADPDRLSQVTNAINNYLTSDTQLGSKITKANFVYYLGANISSHIMELGQSMFSLVPNLVENGAGIVESYKLLGNAAKNVVSNWLHPKNKSWGDKERDRFMVDAEQAELFNNLGAMSEFLDTDHLKTINVRNLGKPKKQLKLGDIVTKPLGMFADASARLYSAFTHTNAKIALLAGFEQKRNQILNGKKRALTETEYREAFEYAKRMNFTANFSGGRAARPEGIFSTRGHSRTASQALWSLQSYSMGMLATYGRMLQKGFGSRSDITPHQRRQAKKAAIQLIGTQLVAAGALGLPFAGAAIALLEQMTDMEVHRYARETLLKMFEDDEELGGIVSDIALRGLPHMLPNAPDVGSRYELGNILGTSSYDGFSLEALAGPTYSLFTNLARGIQAAQQGEMGEAFKEIMPQAFKKPIELIRNDGDIRSRAGQTYIDDLTGMEKVMYAIGFTPQRVAREREGERIIGRANQVASQQYQKLVRNVLERYEQKDIQGGRQLINDFAAKNDLVSVASIARSVAQAAEKRNFPVDLNRLPSSRVGDSLKRYLAGYGQTNPANELERFTYRKQIEQLFGIPGQGQITPNQYLRAQRLDEVMRQNPFLSRVEAQNFIGF